MKSKLEIVIVSLSMVSQYIYKIHLNQCMLLLLVILAGSLCGATANNSALPGAFDREDLLWEIRLGTHQYTIPRIDNGQIFISINDRNLKHSVLKKTGGGIVMCLEEATVKMLWQLPIPR